MRNWSVWRTTETRCLQKRLAEARAHVGLLMRHGEADIFLVCAMR